MVWIRSLNSCKTSLLLLLLNVFLKVRAMYFKADSTISGALQCSACLVGEPPTCSSSTINFIGIESPFLDEVVTTSVLWRNCCLAECLGAFSQLLKYFSKLSSQLMALLQWVHLSFFDGRFAVALLERTECGTLLALVLGFLYWTLHRFLDLSHLLVSHQNHGFELELSIGWSVVSIHCFLTWFIKKIRIIFNLLEQI